MNKKTMSKIKKSILFSLTTFLDRQNNRKSKKANFRAERRDTKVVKKVKAEETILEVNEETNNETHAHDSHNH